MQIVLVFPNGNKFLSGRTEEKYLFLMYGDNHELITSQALTQLKAQRLKERLDETGSLKYSNDGRLDTEYVYQWTPPLLEIDLGFTGIHKRARR